MMISGKTKVWIEVIVVSSKLARQAKARCLSAYIGRFFRVSGSGVFLFLFFLALSFFFL